LGHDGITTLPLCGLHGADATSLDGSSGCYCCCYRNIMNFSYCTKVLPLLHRSPASAEQRDRRNEEQCSCILVQRSAAQCRCSQLWPRLLRVAQREDGRTDGVRWCFGVYFEGERYLPLHDRENTTLVEEDLFFPIAIDNNPLRRRRRWMRRSVRGSGKTSATEGARQAALGLGAFPVNAQVPPRPSSVWPPTQTRRPGTWRLR
jgi:hypothetical protein